MKLDIVFCGVGGQGVVVLSDVFCEAALIDGFDVAKAEIHGMAQRGGSIVAHARLGEKVQAPLRERGEADVLLRCEMLETARSMPMLNANGTVVVNTKYIPPNVAFDCSAKSLNGEQLLRIIRDRARIVHEVDGIGMASNLGNPMVAKTIILRAIPHQKA